jgi:hypothetical protein
VPASLGTYSVSVERRTTGVAVHLLQRERSAGPADQKPADDGIRARDGREIGEDGWGAEPDEGGASTQ